jgi:aromatic ring-cleaving dioxygenase
MKTKNSLLNTHSHYHAHIYFDESSIDLARTLYSEIETTLELELGRFHQKLLGPHSKWMFQVAFSEVEFLTFTHWLEQNRAGLSVLIHPLSGNNLQDHSELASWLGTPIKLNLAIFETHTQD